MKPGQGERLEGPRGPQVSNTTAPAALRKPISERSPSQRARSRWPKQTDATVAAGWREGIETRVKAIGSGSASSRLASQKPVDRPVS